MLLKDLRKRRDHRFTHRHLSAYVDNELPPAQMERIEGHLAVCKECRRELSELQATRDVLSSLSRLQVPCSFTLPASVRDEQRRFHFWDTSYLVLRGAAAVVSVLLVLFVSGEALWRFGVGSGTQMAKQAPDALPSEVLMQEQAGEAREIIETVVVEEGQLEALEQPEALEAEQEVAPPTGVDSLESATVSEEAQTEADEAVGVAVVAPTESEERDRNDAEDSEQAEAAVAERAHLSPTMTIAETAEAAPLAPTQTLSESPLPAPTKTVIAEAVQLPPTPPPTGRAAAAPLELPPTPSSTPAEVVERRGFALQPGSLRDVWETARIVAGILLGLLFMLLGGLIWTGHKRRPY